MKLETNSAYAELRVQVLDWINNDICENSKAELQGLLHTGDTKELVDRMAGPLEFGTAGLRGVLGAGPNRMNLAVVTRSTAGIAEYLISEVPSCTSSGVVIGYDGRRMGRTFAETAASVFAAYGIPVKLFSSPIPTPLVAYATTKLTASASIMITASHNPPEYNGMKVYWRNGAQIIPPHDTGIAREIDKLPGAKDCKRMIFSDACRRGLVVDIPNSLVDDYLREVASLSKHRSFSSVPKIVYTPLHGVGLSLSLKALRDVGYTDIDVVQSQAEPNGEFPTVSSPNPEDTAALKLALDLARERHADLVLANDPDADRVAVATRSADGGSFIHLTGNQVGAIFASYLLEQKEFSTPSSLYITTIVSSPMLRAMAARHEVLYEEVLPGFKWIANKAMDLERERGAKFIFGYEEAIGYTVGPLVRDKDGVGAVAVFGALAAFYKSHGLSIVQKLEDMYRTYGLYLSQQHSVTKKGLDGSKEISQMMSRLRNSPPTSIGGVAVVAKSDYQTGARVSVDGTQSIIALPSSNVLGFDLEDGSRIMARPSGTEPKIKFYFDVREPVALEESVASAQTRAEDSLRGLRDSFLSEGLGIR